MTTGANFCYASGGGCKTGESILPSGQCGIPEPPPPPPPPPACNAGDSATASYLAGYTDGTPEGWTYISGSLTASNPQCDGSCELVVSPSATQNCYSATAPGSPVYCYYDAVKPGNTCTTSTSAGGTANATLPAITTAPAPSCPTGYTANSSGVCVQSTPATSGTAATTTTASTAPTGATVTAYSCPAGYVEVAGRCESVDAGQLVCPTGFTLNASGNCESQNTLGSSTTGIEPTPAEVAAAESSAVAAAAASSTSSLQGALDGAVAG